MPCPETWDLGGRTGGKGCEEGRDQLPDPRWLQVESKAGLGDAQREVSVSGTGCVPASSLRHKWAHPNGPPQAACWQPC